jgi:Flp pilus assembly protein TadD
MKTSFVAVIVAAVLALSAYGQQNQGGQQGGQPAPTQPPPDKTPRQPIPQPQPTIPTQRELFIRGRIIADAHTTFSILEVRIEMDGGQPLGVAYANPEGEFTFRQSGFGTDQSLYVVVNLEGFKPYRERIGGVFGLNGFDGTVTIFLERENTVRVPAKGGPAVIDIKQLRAKIPGKAVDEYEKALKESTKGNYGKAVEGLQRAIKLAPDFYEAQHTLGIQYVTLNKYDEAETALLRARDLSPKASEPLINLGSLYYKRGETQSDAGRKEEAATIFQKAADFFQESIQRNPLSAQAHVYLGSALYKLASYEQAETELNRALDLDKDLHDARLTLLNVYTRQARYNEALEQANIYLEKNPKAPQRPALEAIKKQIENAIAQGKQ